MVSCLCVPTVPFSCLTSSPLRPHAPPQVEAFKLANDWEGWKWVGVHVRRADFIRLHKSTDLADFVCAMRRLQRINRDPHHDSADPSDLRFFLATDDPSAAEEVAAEFDHGERWFDPGEWQHDPGGPTRVRPGAVLPWPAAGQACQLAGGGALSSCRGGDVHMHGHVLAALDRYGLLPGSPLDAVWPVAAGS